ncbi:MAG TPA: SoxR reducing system RseC family protein [Firmicutes bacterium]|nr:SoxR reducing system RseC family protein [Bacillota bacterium]
MREGGIVKEVKGDTAVVALRRTQACAHCGRCGAFTATTPDFILVEAKNLAGAKEGDDVDLEMEPGTVYKAALLLYGIPLILGGCGYLLGRAVIGGDAGGLLLAVIFVGLGYLIVRAYDRTAARSESFKPTIVAIIGRGESREDEKS